MPRPIAITVIAILAVLFGALTLPVKLLVVLSPEIYATLEGFMPAASEDGLLAFPLPLQLAHSLTGSVVWIAAGVALWKGINWGRWLAMVWGATVLLLTLAVAGFGLSLALKSATFAVMCYLLTSRRAADYFNAGKAPL